MLVEGTLRSLAKLMEFLDRASRYDGRPRERAVALQEADELYYRLYPGHYLALQLIRAASHLNRRITDRRTVPVQRCESRFVSLLLTILGEALRTGDLVLSGARTAEEVAFSLWALALGTRTLMNARLASRTLDVEGGIVLAREATELLMDALHWRPLSNEWDYEQTRRRIRQTLFAEEWQQARSQWPQPA